MKIFKVFSGVTKFLFLKLFYGNQLQSRKLSLFSWRSCIVIEKKGELILKGKTAFSAYCELRAIGKISIGKKVYFNKFSRIIAHSNIEIGDNVLIAQFVSILDHDHHYSFNEANQIGFDGYNVESIHIGNNVLIGDKVTILKGSHIGDNVIIGANSLIRGVIPSNSIVFSATADTKSIQINPLPH
jgi:acetyltransferase-like isoleucine patch superfamily enzyme